MDSPSRREPGSEDPAGRESGSTPRVIRAPKPLARPKAPAEPPPEKKPLERAKPLKPGDRLWSKPTKKRSASNERRVYLSSEDYEAENPTPPETPAPRRADGPPEDRRPGSSQRPPPGGRSDRPSFGKGRPPKKFEGRASRRPEFKKEGPPKKFNGKPSGRPEFRKEGPPKRFEGKPTGRPEFKKEGPPNRFEAKPSARPEFKKEGPPKKFEGQAAGRPEFKKERPPKKFEGRAAGRPEFKKDSPPKHFDGKPSFSKERPARKFEDRAAGRPEFKKDGPPRKFEDRSGPKDDTRHSWKSGAPAGDRRPSRPAPAPKPDLRARTQGKPLRAATTPFWAVKDNLRAAAARVLYGVLERGGQLKSLVQTEQGRFSHEGDRALVREISAGVLRHLSLIDWSFTQAASRGVEATPPELRALVRVGLYQILFLERVPVYAAVDQCVEAAKSVGTGAAGFVNGVLRTAAERREEFREAPFQRTGSEGLGLRYGMPRWVVDRYLARFGEEEAERLLAALQEPAGAVLFFPDAGRLAQARPILEREGFLQKPDSAFPLTLHVSGGNPADSEAFRKGLFYVADPASQVPALLLPLPTTGAALDLCAAPGGKTVVLSGRMPEGGWILSTDVNRRRIVRIEENIARLGLKNVRLAQVDAGRALPFGPQFASVLLDAPCSALGTLRRNPEIRWQVKPEGFGAFAERQRAFLGQAASAVAPGGHLLYSVCSLEREETLAVAERFLDENRVFRPAPLEPQGFLAPLLERAGEGAAFCMPHRHAWDGFFVALFKKKG